MTPKGKPSARKHNIVIQHVDNETLVYDLTKNKAYCLNETSALVWRECNGTLDADKISQKISKTLKTPVSEDIVWLALSQFKKDGLLDEKEEFVTPFDGMNRRDVVKRIGFASVVALPVISSLIAPRAINAQSANNCAPIGNCTAGSTTVCTCTPPVQPGGNNNPAGCRCLTNGDCQGDCSCGNPCTAGPACPTGETCQSGVCRNSQGGGSLNLCNGNCPQGTTCITDTTQSNFGSCSGVCLASPFNFCVGGNSTPICIPNNGGNLSAPCCPCSIDGDCAGDCSNNNQGPPGVCI